MKRILSVVSLTALLAVPQIKAGNYYNPNFQPGCVSPAPVCQSPVAYYQAPVCAPQPVYNYNCYPRYNPNVVHIGGRYNNYYNSKWNGSCGGTQIIRFGHIQAHRQGYQFRSRR